MLSNVHKPKPLKEKIIVQSLTLRDLVLGLQYLTI